MKFISSKSNHQNTEDPFPNTPLPKNFLFPGNKVCCLGINQVTQTARIMCGNCSFENNFLAQSGNWWRLVMGDSPLIDLYIIYFWGCLFYCGWGCIHLNVVVTSLPQVLQLEDHDSFAIWSPGNAKHVGLALVLHQPTWSTPKQLLSLAAWGENGRTMPGLTLLYVAM